MTPWLCHFLRCCCRRTYHKDFDDDDKDLPLRQFLKSWQKKSKMIENSDSPSPSARCLFYQSWFNTLFVARTNVKALTRPSDKLLGWGTDDQGYDSQKLPAFQLLLCAACSLRPDLIHFRLSADFDWIHHQSIGTLHFQGFVLVKEKSLVYLNTSKEEMNPGL